MSDYASCITEPFWQRDMPDVHALFVAEGWTEIGGDKSCLAFANVDRDQSEEGIATRVWWILVHVAELLPPTADFRISVNFDGGRRESYGARDAKERSDFEHRVWEARDAARQAMAERADRDRRENEGVVNPDLDAFLEASPADEAPAKQQGFPMPTEAECAAYEEENRIQTLSVTVAQVIAALSALPPDAEVEFLYDGFITPHASAIWLARSGRVIIGQAGESVYHSDDQPEGVESEDWHPPPFDGADP